MKAFVKWLVLALFIFATSAGGYHLYLESHPRRVLVILDASFPMGAVWEKVPPVLESLERRPYTLFALASDKGRIHGWSRDFNLGRAVPYAPRNLKDLRQRLQLPELKEASEVYLITNASRDELGGLDDWRIVHPGH